MKPKPINVFVILDAVDYKVAIPAIRFAPRVKHVKVKRYLLPS